MKNLLSPFLILLGLLVGIQEGNAGFDAEELNPETNKLTINRILSPQELESLAHLDIETLKITRSRDVGIKDEIITQFNGLIPDMPSLKKVIVSYFQLYQLQEDTLPLLLEAILAMPEIQELHIGKNRTNGNKILDCFKRTRGSEKNLIINLRNIDNYYISKELFSRKFKTKFSNFTFI